MMRQLGLWIGLVALLGGTAASGCGGEAACSPQCGPLMACYYGVCVPVARDAGTDGTVEAQDDGAPRDSADDAAVDVPHETGTCTTAADCDDGSLCTQDLCDPATGLCHHPIAPDNTVCEDDGDPCTADVCLDGYCNHPPGGACCTTDAECDDGNVCTDDVCDGGMCTNNMRDNCCTRDADCMWAGHLWECDASINTCYQPPAGVFCAMCMSHVDCGDGGASSDDYCVTYSGTDRGCSKDCLDDLDCPGGAVCTTPDGSAACADGETDCLCLALLGSCAAYNRFGNYCMMDTSCTAGCAACSALVCRSGGCTWPCSVDRDCPTGAACDAGFCARTG